MINAITGHPGTGMTYQCSPADVSEAARTVVAPASSGRSGERLKSVSHNGKSSRSLIAKPTALASVFSVAVLSFGIENFSKTLQSVSSNPEPVEFLPFPVNDNGDLTSDRVASLNFCHFRQLFR